MARGFLAGQHGKYQEVALAGAQFSHAITKFIARTAKEHHGSQDTWATQSAYTDLTSRVGEIVAIFRDAGRTESLTQLALKYCVSHPAVTVTIPGIKKPSHIADALGALGIPDVDRALLQSLCELDDRGSH